MIGLQKFSVQNYKKIGDRITLENLKRVNYLVGENGSGKSSILESIFFTFHPTFRQGSSLTELTKHFGSLESVVKDLQTTYMVYAEGLKPLIDSAFVDKQKYLNNEFCMTSKNSGSVAHITLKYLFFHNIDSTLGGLLEVIKFDKDEIEHGDGEKIKDFANTNHFFGEKKADRISRSVGGDRCIQFELIDEKHTKINLKSLSQGNIGLLSLYQNIRLIAEKSPNNVQIILIEEPENYFHPNYQKKLPEILKEISEENPKLQLFITTHSPFIISKASEYKEDQNVYVMNDGEFIDEKGNQSLVSKGLSGRHAIPMASLYLGSDFKDLTLYENICLLEEASLEGLLKKLREQTDIIKTWHFISCKGKDRTSTISQRLDNIIKSDETLIIKCNPLYGDSYIVITDKFSEKDTKLDSYKNLEKLGERFKPLNEFDLEDYYKESANPDIKKIYKTFEENIKKIKGNKDTIKELTGKLKCKAALEVADVIIASSTPKALFEETFKGELDFLLK